MGNPALDAVKECSTLGQAFRRVVEIGGERVAVRTLDDSTRWTWRQLQERVDRLAAGLVSLGLERGDTLALMLTNRPEFFVADLAAVTIGAVPFSIYQTLAPEQIEYVVADAGARIAIIERAFLDQFTKARQGLRELEHVIVIDGDGSGGTLSLADVEKRGADFDPAAACAAGCADDLLTLIYTSGTTGPPKGVQLTHRNLFHVIDAMTSLVDIPPEGRVISWLPTAHIAERALNYYVPLASCATITTCPNPREIATYLPQVKPTVFFAVPRIWEKMKAGLEAKLASQPAEQRELMESAIAASLQRVRLRQAGQPVPMELETAVRKADAEMFAFVRALLGLDEAAVVIVGAAPTPREVIEFFHALGIELAEGWGMSETCCIGTGAAPGEVRIGTVGKPLAGIELALADDGEILVRGPNNMVGYRNLPEKTAEALDADGWLHTGDIGEIDAEGYLKIVDRKKELIINSAGKNMSPANIESTMKGSCPLIGQICVIGDARAYNTALIVLDPDAAPAWAVQNGLEGLCLAELARNEAMRAAVQTGIDAGNAKLARVEQIKKFVILPEEWQPGGTELTPTMKLKRKPIGEKYAGEIAGLYAGDRE